MRTFLICFASLTAALSLRADNLIQQGDFSGGTEGGQPPAPWQLAKSADNTSVTIAKLPDAGDEKLWARFVDESPEGAAGMFQEFQEISSGRLSFKLHVVRYDAAVWFVLGKGRVGRREDMNFGFKVGTKGRLIVAAGEQKIQDTTSRKIEFESGKTYNLYCTFRPGASGLDIEIGHEGGEVMFQGTNEILQPVSALAIRTHMEDSGSDFYVTDIVLSGGGS